MLERPGWSDFVFAFHDIDEIGSRMSAGIAQRTRLGPGEQVTELLIGDRMPVPALPAVPLAPAAP